MGCEVVWKGEVSCTTVNRQLMYCTRPCELISHLLRRTVLRGRRGDFQSRLADSASRASCSLSSRSERRTTLSNDVRSLDAQARGEQPAAV